MHERTFRIIWIVISALNPSKKIENGFAYISEDLSPRKEDATVKSLGRIIAQGFE